MFLPLIHYVGDTLSHAVPDLPEALYSSPTSWN